MFRLFRRKRSDEDKSTVPPAASGVSSPFLLPSYEEAVAAGSKSKFKNKYCNANRRILTLEEALAMMYASLDQDINALGRNLLADCCHREKSEKGKILESEASFLLWSLGKLESRIQHHSDQLGQLADQLNQDW